ncbi:hypothetical protein Goshw_013178 [Gossypium schwendimanii]|uniref:Myb/SANT-like domain-containing protein n=2 Tax=Gossypium schwendimanii TaxID=34291 RepID=A0A7J9MXD0_GOSSC|nr:hypothetical protein [Gossypium schwendimanii]
MESTLVVEVSGEKVKAMWDKRLTEIFCDLCIKEILEVNRPDTHFTKVGWLKIKVNFETKTGKTYSQRQFKNRWDALKKEWKTWKKLKGEDTDLGWNLIKGTVDTSDDWKLDQMFMRIVITGDKAWTPSSGILPSDFFEDFDNDILGENEEENAINDVHISSQVGCDFDENNQKKEKHLRQELHILKLE